MDEWSNDELYAVILVEVVGNTIKSDTTGLDRGGGGIMIMMMMMRMRYRKVRMSTS